jgi:hypothetical protein
VSKECKRFQFLIRRKFMQTKMQSFVKLIFLALVFGSLVGCGSDDNKAGGYSGGVTNCTQDPNAVGCPGYCAANPSATECQVDCSKPENGNNSACPTDCVNNPNDPRCPAKAISYFALEDDTFLEEPRHIFGRLWDSASLETHTITYSSVDKATADAYATKVEGKFPNVLQKLGSLLAKLGGLLGIQDNALYHSAAWYENNLIGDASVAITNNNGSYSITQAIDIVLPIPYFTKDVNSTVFDSDKIFPKLDGALTTYPISEVKSTIHYGYFGSPNFQTYKAKLAKVGFKPENGIADDNVWTLKKDGLVYTFEHDNPLLDATKIGALSKINILGTTLAGFINHWINNWTNIDKYASWKISVE